MLVKRGLITNLAARHGHRRIDQLANSTGVGTARHIEAFEAGVDLARQHDTR